MDADQTYESYRRFASSLGLKPLSKAEYETSLQCEVDCDCEICSLEELDELDRIGS